MKKLLPVLLLLALLLSACSGGATAAAPAGDDSSGTTGTSAPVTVGAQDHTLIRFVGDGVEISGGGARDEGGAVTISAAGTYELSGVSSGRVLVVDTGDDPMDVTLILNNVQITGLSEPALHVRQAKHFRLYLAQGSTNVLIHGSEELLQSPDPQAVGAALYSEDDMDIEGEGTLAVYGYRNNGIGCKKDLDINSGSIAVLAANHGVKGNQSVQIKGGSLSVSAWGDGIKSETTDKEGKGYVEISGGSVSVEAWGDGVQAATELRLSGGTLSIIARGDGSSRSSKGLKAQTLVSLSAGSVTLNSREDGLRCTTGNVEISGGSLDILSPENGISAGEKASGLGDITITGGELNISAGKQALKARGGLTVSGGSVLALSGSDKQSAPAGGPYLFCSLAGAQGETLQIGELDGIAARQNYRCLLYVSPQLSAGQVLTVSRPGTTLDVTVK